MKASLKIILPLLLLTTAVLAQKTPPTAKTPSLKNREDSIQYSLGSYMGNYLIKGGFSSLNLDLFLVGLNDVYRNNSRIIKDSIAFVLLSKYQDENLLKRSKFLEEQLFEVLKTKPGVGKLPSGVQFLVINPGKGPKPQETDSIVIHYKGTLASGEVFENTFLSKGGPVTVTPASMIPGMSEVLQLMPTGATYEAFIPSALAYGAKGTSGIPPNSALLVTVELVRIKK